MLTPMQLLGRAPLPKRPRGVRGRVVLHLSAPGPVRDFTGHPGGSADRREAAEAGRQACLVHLRTTGAAQTRRQVGRAIGVSDAVASARLSELKKVGLVGHYSTGAAVLWFAESAGGLGGKK